MRVWADVEMLHDAIQQKYYAIISLHFTTFFLLFMRRRRYQIAREHS